MSHATQYATVMMLGLNISQPVFEVKRRRVLLAVVLSLLGASLVYYVLTTPRGGLPHFVNRMVWKSFYGEDSCSDNGNRAALQRLLKWWLDVSTKHNIMYTLARGSLLGAVRHEDLIPRDFDLDVMLDYKYFTFLEKEAEPFPFNFNPKDGQIHLVILPKSEHSKSISNRSAYTCQGEVSRITNNQPVHNTIFDVSQTRRRKSSVRRLLFLEACCGMLCQY